MVPKTLAIVVDAISGKKEAGAITVRYPQVQNTAAEDEYDEEEQLYSAVGDLTLQKSQATDIPLFYTGTTLFVVVPHFPNAIAYNLVAKEIAKLPAKSWLTLAPCMLNNGQTVCRLDASDRFAEVPLLQPPHYITGISAALISALDDLSSTGVLVLNAEGHPGFEKVDADSIMDAAEVLAGSFTEDKVAYIKKLSQTVRKLNSSATSGMYI